jgi:hypothetical protein
MSTRIHANTLHLGPNLRIDFQRTLRIPDDGKTYPLPPGLGHFPIRRVDDYIDRVPADWGEHGGVFIPMYQREAMWLCFSHREDWRPTALKIAVGKVCAITGNSWSEDLCDDPQDYVVTPDQPWLDGISVGGGQIRQFVAMPLGMGYTVEGQVTGEETHGGIQLKAFEPKAGLFKKPTSRRHGLRFGLSDSADVLCCAMEPTSGAMGLAAGGRMRQSIYPDLHGLGTWDARTTSRSFVHIVDSELWREITGEAAPSTPVTAKEYERAGLPWFDLYDERRGTLEGSDTLRRVTSVKEKDLEKSTHPLQQDGSVAVPVVVKLGVKGKTSVDVRDGSW